MSSPLVSIIIPTFNRAHLIMETLDSLVAQTYINWECIVVDDGSTDDSEFVINEFVKKDNRFRYYNRPVEKVKGASSCRNFGLSIANGEYVVFLDSDDLLLYTCLEGRMIRIQENKGFVFFVFPMLIENVRENRRKAAIPNSENYLIDFLSCKIYWQTMCTIWEINFIKKINGFKELFPRLNDPEIHIRGMIAAKNNFKVFNEIEPDSIYREAIIKDENSFALNYLNTLKLFIPEISSCLLDSNKKGYIAYLKHYLDHYYKDFQQNTKWIDMINLFGFFYNHRVITRFDCFNRTISFLFFKFGKIKFNLFKKLL
jgi:glycosyltransferase involved in cell wall biosynthesis